MTENEISHKIIGVAIDVHRHFGPGLLESVYEYALAHELRLAGLSVEQQVPLPLTYKGVKLECGYRLDIYVERKVIVEVKSIEELGNLHFAQTLTYLKLSECKLGLLINFNTLVLAGGINRVVNNL